MAKSALATAPKAGTGGPDDGAEPTVKRSRKKLLTIVVLLVALIGAGAWFFLLRGGVDGPPPPPEPGPVLALESININLAEGHYLKLGLALETSADVAEAPDGSKALDAAIALFSGRNIADLSSTEARGSLKEELMVKLEEAYHGEVLGVYFTEFVMQ